eukprot:XP_001705319.1 Hypothetical protein GL50803_35564 [Giardia lamblia ATCC 50803]
MTVSEGVDHRKQLLNRNIVFIQNLAHGTDASLTISL